jgi:hypothetical protein
VVGVLQVIDSYLRVVNPNMGVSITIDRKPPFPWQWEEYHKANPLTEYHSMSTQAFSMTRSYDLCFIDANHRYKAVKGDWLKVRDFCKFIAFHDIAAFSDKPYVLTSRHFWQVVRADHKISIITEDPRITFMAGIGIIWND